MINAQKNGVFSQLKCQHLDNPVQHYYNMRTLFGLRKKKEPPPVKNDDDDVFGPTTLLIPNYKYILEFGPEENRSDSSLILSALKDDKSGSMYAIRYTSDELLADEEFNRRALKTVAHTYLRLQPSEKRLVQFDQYGSLNSSLDDGGVKLLKGQWLVDMCESSDPVIIPRRQELPPEAFHAGPVGSVAYVQSLVMNTFFRFYLSFFYYGLFVCSYIYIYCRYGTG
jgi:hypothetical protein